MQKQTHKFKVKSISRRIRHDIVYVIVRILLLIAYAIPRKAGLALFEKVGFIIGLLSFSDRKTATQNLTSIYGKVRTSRQIRACVWQVYRELGKNIFDSLYLSRCSDKRFNALVRHDSLDEISAAYNKGKGIIAITGHIGCFEMQLHFMARTGHKAFAIGRQLYDPRIDRIVKGIRSGRNIKYLYRDGNIRGIIECLREGRVMGALIDQDTKVDGVFAHFLGKLAHTPSGPMRLAMRYGIPVFVVTTARQKDNTHYVYISKSLSLDSTGNADKDLVTNIEKANSLISDAIKKNPEQWVWMHKRWRKSPQDPGFGHILNIEDYGK